MTEPITIVSGLPRSGTSLMMRSLEAGGLLPLTDGLRASDPDNPLGYYEYEPVKGLKDDASWLPLAQGRAVKLVSMLLYHLPPTYVYKIIFMQRELDEVLASQRRMLERRGSTPDPQSDVRLRPLFERHLIDLEKHLAARPELSVLYVGHRQMIDSPLEQAQRIHGFLGIELDVEAMAGVSDRSLYRNQSQKRSPP